MRKALIIANWKMHKTESEASNFIVELKAIAPELYIAAPYTLISLLEGMGVHVGAQNLCHLPDGAMTGEISARMVAASGASFALIGHSERRIYFSETNSQIRAKIHLAIEANLVPILCVGENLEQRDSGLAEKVVALQLNECLEGFNAQQMAHLVVAYEPVWAIGTGRNAGPEVASAMHGHIRRLISERFSKEFAASLRILYGGSVKSSNISALMSAPDIDGALVGGAALDPVEFAAILHYKN